ncbi:MAG: HtaA domain-containing protein [Patulibacter sp.]
MLLTSARLSSSPSRRSLALGLLAVILTAAISWALPTGARAATHDITEAPALTWGFKKSWRTYVGVPAMSGDVTATPESWGSSTGYNLSWPFTSGTYDDETNTTVLHYSGTVRWQKYPGWGDLPDDQYALDVQLADPTVTISADGSAVSVVGRTRHAGTDTDFGRVDVSALAVDQVTPTVIDGGTTTWSDIPASLAKEGQILFEPNAEQASYYPIGAAIDTVSVSYTGLGGAPDFSDNFAAPGIDVLDTDGDNFVYAPATQLAANQFSGVVDADRKLAYLERRLGDGSQAGTVAFDLDTGEQLPGELPGVYAGTPLFVDNVTGRAYYNETSSVDAQTYTKWVRYDRATSTLTSGTLSTALPSASGGMPLGWDRVNRRAFTVVLTVPTGASTTDYASHQWKLRTYSPADEFGDEWTVKDYDLPNASQLAQNRFLYRSYGMTGASDGSLIVLGDRRATTDATNAPAPSTVPGAFRIVTTGDTATATAIPGTDRPNNSLQLYDFAKAGSDGVIALARTGSVATEAVGGAYGTTKGFVQSVDVTPATGGIQAEALVPVPLSTNDSYGRKSVTVSPDDGTIWIGGSKTKAIVGIRDGRVVAKQTINERTTVADSWLQAFPNGVFWMQSTELDAAGNTTDTLFGQANFGFQKLKRLGVTATVSMQPVDRSVSLGAGVASEEVTFSVVQEGGDPVPSLAWQVKAPGATRFVAIDGATDSELRVVAAPGMDGTQYRAVFTNAAGAVASDVATLSVEYAPSVSFDLVDTNVRVGEDAEFSVAGSGNPEPSVAWQRCVPGADCSDGDAWSDIASDAAGFEVSDSLLTVNNTTAAQSGTKFRAKFTNSAGTAYSRAATLSVVVPQARTLTGVQFDWTGSAELQRRAPNGAANYFSAGISDGDQASYLAADGAASVLHRASDGTLTAATWATRDAFLSDSGAQVVRLSGGSGEAEADGSLQISWDASFSVNMYGGLVPFTVTDPVLTLDGDGNGTLTALLSGYSSSMSDATTRDVVPPTPNVTIATFTGGVVDTTDDATSTLTPAYAGVQVDTPSHAPQLRSGTGWGSWPQSFVDFHQLTGLGSYWYTSGGSADPYKAPTPITLTIGVPAPDPTPTPTPTADPTPTATPDPTPDPSPTTQAEHEVTVNANVNDTLALTLTSTTATLGRFLPGVAANYDTSITATATTTGPSLLTIEDPGSDPGYLLNAGHPLAAPLKACATSSSSPSCAYANVTGAPQTLLAFDNAAATPLTVGLRQPISATEQLTAGTYGKTLTLTLSSGTP